VITLADRVYPLPLHSASQTSHPWVSALIEALSLAVRKTLLTRWNWKNSAALRVLESATESSAGRDTGAGMGGGSGGRDTGAGMGGGRDGAGMGGGRDTGAGMGAVTGTGAGTGDRSTGGGAGVGDAARRRLDPATVHPCALRKRSMRYISDST
jgi:hypothetical protein